MMDADRKGGADAFEFLDEFFYLSSADSPPDEAIDWIFMMHDRDWELLEKAWKERPSKWREHCAYILGLGSLSYCMPTLFQYALFDDDIDVARQAALSITGLLIDYDEEYDPTVYLDDEMVVRIRCLIEHLEYAEEDTKILENFRYTSDGRWEFIPHSS